MLKVALECSSKIGSSLLKCSKVASEAKSGLKFLPKATSDVVEIAPKLVSDIRALKNDEIMKFLGKDFKFLNLPEEELLYTIRSNGVSNAQREALMNYLTDDVKCAWSRYLFEKEGVNIFEADAKLLDAYGEKGNLTRAKFIRAFDEILFPQSKNAKVLEIEKKLASIGVDARLTDHEQGAQYIYNAYKNMYDKGVREFPKVRYSILKDGTNEAIANKNLQDRYVIYTDDMFNMVKEQKGYFANPTPEGIVYHEAGHIFNNVGFSNTAAGDMSAYQKMANELSIPSEVSEYSYCLDEFMPEYFSGIMGGKKYSQSIAQFYESNGGYVPPSLRM